MMYVLHLSSSSLAHFYGKLRSLQNLQVKIGGCISVHAVLLPATKTASSQEGVIESIPFQCVPEALSGVIRAVGNSDVEHLIVQDVHLFLFLFLQSTRWTRLFWHLQYECDEIEKSQKLQGKRFAETLRLETCFSPLG